MITNELIEDRGVTGSEYLSTIDEKYIDRWNRKIDQVSFTEEELEFLNSNFIPIKIVVISGGWCPDCQNAVPIIIKMGEISSFLDVYVLDRDKNREFLDEYKTNGGLRIPFVMFTNEKLEEISRWSEKSTYTYELIHAAKLKALDNNDDDYGNYVRENFRENSSKMFEMNKQEIFQMMKKAVFVRNSSAKLHELQVEQTILN